MERQLSDKVWSRLLARQSLKDLNLPVQAGKVILRGIGLPSPGVLPPDPRHGSHHHEVKIHAVTWKDLDFSEAILPDLRILDSTLENCIFSRADCHGWRLWNTRVVSCDFDAASLAGASLGGLAADGLSRNTFQAVRFRHADLRRTVYVTCKMVDCDFSNARLSNIDFQGTVFEKCIFAGKLQDVIFAASAFRKSDMEVNRMDQVDMQRAMLEHVEFRNLDMESVKWPSDECHIVVKDYRKTLETLIAEYSVRKDTSSRRLVALLRFRRQWAGPHQRCGVFSKLDLMDAIPEKESLRNLWDRLIVERV